MKQILPRLVAAIASLPLLISSTAYAESSSPLSGSAAATFASAYVFRGFRNYDGASIQPNLLAEYKSDYGTIGGNVWSQLSADGEKEGGKLTEIDYTLIYTYSFDPVTLKAGHIWYTYPQDRNGDFFGTREMFLTTALDDSKIGNAFPLNPTLTAYYDYDALSGTYFELGFSHLIEGRSKAQAYNVTPYVTFGFASSETTIYSNNGLEQVTFGASTQLPLGALNLTPSLSYTSKVDSATSNTLWFTVTASWAS